MALENSVQYLGMTIDNNMSWDNHINNVGKKMSRENGILCKLRTCDKKHSYLYIMLYSTRKYYMVV